MKKANTHPAAETDDFKNMINLLSVYTAAHNALTGLEHNNNEQYLEIVDDKINDYAQLQKSLTEAETSLEIITRKHPEWFKTSQSIKTPYGTVQFRESTKLVVENPEVSILLIRHREESDARDEQKKPEEKFKATNYVRTEEKLNLEALEGMTDVELAELRIKRIPSDNFSVKPAKIDMGKAVKEACELKEVA